MTWRDDRCIPEGDVVGGEVINNGVSRCCCHHINLVQSLGGNEVVCFHIPAQTKGLKNSIGGSTLCWWWRHTMFVAAQSINGGGGEKKGSWRKC